MKTERGFTLLEVLVAVSVLGIALVAVLQVFSGALRSVSLSKDYVDAVCAAQSRMRSVLSLDRPEKGVWEEHSEDGYAYRIEVEKNDYPSVENLPMELLNIRVTVIWHSGEKERTYTLETMKAVSLT